MSVVARIALASSEYGNDFLRSSWPRKKLRHTGISGTTARFWYTVAMPLSSASAGEPNVIGSPSTSSSPSVCWCSPEMILIRVDLPAPLSPRMPVTSPACTRRQMSLSAVMFP